MDLMGNNGELWSPYLVGTFIGLLSMATFYFSNQPIGASTGYARISGIIGKYFSKMHTNSLSYFQETKPIIQWDVMFLIGIFLGAFAAAYLDGGIKSTLMPTLWEERFGSSYLFRFCLAFIGGLIMAFGARLAGGCTSGHGISGTAQLSVGSWLALLCFFIGGAITANLIFNV